MYNDMQNCTIALLESHQIKMHLKDKFDALPSG